LFLPAAKTPQWNGYDGTDVLSGWDGVEMKMQGLKMQGLVPDLCRVPGRLCPDSNLPRQNHM
jgi:hypothetical protein